MSSACHRSPRAHPVSLLSALVGLVSLSITSSTFAQTPEVNTFSQDGVSVLVIKNRYPVEVYIAVDGKWQGRVPAGAVAYMPVEGFVTQDSGFDAEGTLKVKHAFGGFAVRSTMQIRYLSVTGYGVPDPEDAGTSYETYVDGSGPVQSSDATGQGYLGYIVGPPPHEIADHEYERMTKMLEGQPQSEWFSRAGALGEPRELGGEEAATLANAGSSAGGTVKVYGGIPGETGIASLVFLIDTSGSMSGSKLAAAKSSAIRSIERISSDQTEIAIFGFSGSCDDPIPAQQIFTTDRSRLGQFINRLSSGGGTPLATAYAQVSRYMAENKSSRSRNQLLILLADGDDDCGGLDPALVELKERGFLFRTETIGLGIDGNPSARDQLQMIASRSGGGYHDSMTAEELSDIFDYATATDVEKNLKNFRNSIDMTMIQLPQRLWYLSETEVTQAQWSKIMGNNPSSFKGDSRPVARVSWNDAMDFCRRLTERDRAGGALPAGYAYTLPTEQQWEHACRAGTTGDYAGNLDEMAWYDRNSVDQPREVATKKPNAWGFYDMHGNVWEWCLNEYGEGRATGAVRGGGWFYPADRCRSASRFWYDPGIRDHDAIGLRPAAVPSG